MNHLAPFYFTYLVLDILNRSPSPRIINVSSMAHASDLNLETIHSKQSFNAYQSYAWSKLANILFTFRLSDLVKDKLITVNCLHPGVINTKLLKAGWGPIGDSVKVGAQTSLFLAISDEVKEISGKCFVNKHIVNPTSIAFDSKVQKALWNYSEEVFGIKYINKVK